MSTNFPTNLDTLTNPTGTDNVADVDHASQHANANDAIEALQAKVGADSSAVSSSHDYKLSEVTSTDKAVGKTATQTLTNKTLTSPVLNGTISGTGVVGVAQGGTGQTAATGAFNALSPLTTQGDVIYHNGTNNVRLPVGSTGQVLSVVGGNPTWSDASTVSAEQTAQFIETTMLGGINSNTVQYYSDTICGINTVNTNLFLQIDGAMYQSYNTTSDWADADIIRSVVVLGDYVYVLLVDTGATPDARRIYRYSKTNLSAGGTLMSFAGATTLQDDDDNIIMTSDGTDFYLSFEAGNSGNDYVLAKYTLSGTTLTYDSSITCGSTSGRFDQFHVFNSGDIYAVDVTGTVVYKYNSSGTLQATSSGYSTSFWSFTGLVNLNDNLFIRVYRAADRQGWTRIYVA